MQVLNKWNEMEFCCAYIVCGRLNQNVAQRGVYFKCRTLFNMSLHWKPHRSPCRLAGKGVHGFQWNSNNPIIDMSYSPPLLLLCLTRNNPSLACAPFNNKSSATFLTSKPWNQSGVLSWFEGALLWLSLFDVGLFTPFCLVLELNILALEDTKEEVKDQFILHLFWNSFK